MPKTISEQQKIHLDFNLQAASYLFAQFLKDEQFVISPQAAQLYRDFENTLKEKKANASFENSLSTLEDSPNQQFQLARKWLLAYISQIDAPERSVFVNEAAVLLMADSFQEKQISKVATEKDLEGLHGDHTVITDERYHLNYHTFFNKLNRFSRENKVQYQEFVSLKKKLVSDYRKALRLEEFRPRILSSFIRNKLIDKVYLPVFGANLAKQIGTTGQGTRTDRMGLLLLISPPGYGKTTLMEYIANRLGLIFMKINGPAVGHNVSSLDPEDASNRAAAQELEKLNLAFEMGNNVMIYLDDIQHCNPEFLQKFISLCDAQRKIEGVWRGQSKTYDFRGKRVCIVMAGNPYTESGQRFQIPDMLANRADIYNLGDIIGDNERVFKLSYIENALTSNPILSNLAGKSMADVYALIEVAEAGEQEGLQLEANHTPEELDEYVSVLRKMIEARNTVLKVNQEYINSAAMDDDYRTEPAFKLQGSYRDMNKLAERIVPIMNEEELQTLLLAHYEGEAQTLTSDAEANFLKLKELLGSITKEESDRWKSIKKTFLKNRVFTKVDGHGPVSQLVAQMSRFSEGIEGVKDVLQTGLENAKASTKTKRK